MNGHLRRCWRCRRWHPLDRVHQLMKGVWTCDDPDRCHRFGVVIINERGLCEFASPPLTNTEALDWKLRLPESRIVDLAVLYGYRAQMEMRMV